MSRSEEIAALRQEVRELRDIISQLDTKANQTAPRRVRLAHHATGDVGDAEAWESEIVFRNEDGADRTSGNTPYVDVKHIHDRTIPVFEYQNRWFMFPGMIYNIQLDDDLGPATLDGTETTTASQQGKIVGFRNDSYDSATPPVLTESPKKQPFTQAITVHNVTTKTFMAKNANDDYYTYQACLNWEGRMEILGAGGGGSTSCEILKATFGVNTAWDAGHLPLESTWMPIFYVPSDAQSAADIRCTINQVWYCGTPNTAPP